MSTKTLRKRIALVAVSALTAGLVSVVAVPSANAAVIGTTSVWANSSTGSASTILSAGVLSASNSNGALGQTAILLNTGTISVTGGNGTSGSAQNIVVTGGTVTAVDNADGTSSGEGTAAISGTATAPSTIATIPATASHVSVLNASIKPNSGASTMTITIYDGATTTAATKFITVSVVATSTFNAFSASESTVYWGTGSSDTATTDATAANSSKANAGILKGEVTLKDAYGNLLASDAVGVLTATVTGGGLVKLGSATSAGTTNLDYSAATGSAIAFNVQQATANAPASVTVTFAFNGVTFATKTGVIAGEVASISVSSAKIGLNGSNTGFAEIAYKDAKGNAVYPTSGTSAVASTLGTVVTAMSVGTYPASGTTGLISATCGLNGTAKGLKVQHYNTSGTVVTSNAFDAGCAAAPYTVSAAWDKKSYTPGSIATLTLTFKDVDGNLASAYSNIGGTGSAVTLTVTGGPSAAAVTPIADGDKPSGVTGQKTYQYVVGTTEGDYVAVIVPAAVKANNADQANLSVAYSVKGSSVTNADVLKAIVSLIASINKQIAALQKALLKR